MSQVESTDSKLIHRPQYSFANPDSALFLTGTPLSGKSTIAPLVAANIEGCTVQNMDIIRLLAQEMETRKPESERNPFVRYGSCDSYLFVGDGSYSPQSLVTGFNYYARAVSSLLTGIIPRLEVQGAQRVLFEGVQLTPGIVSPFLVGNNKLIVITSDEARLGANRDKRYGKDKELLERYSLDRLLLLQGEIMRQSQQVPPDKIFFVDNSGDYIDSTMRIIRLLIAEGIIA